MDRTINDKIIFSVEIMMAVVAGGFIFIMFVMSLCSLFARVFFKNVSDNLTFFFKKRAKTC